MMVFTIMFIGTFGVHYIEKMPVLDAFYFMSMIATGQGPYYIPTTVLGKLFVAAMSFISVGVAVAALGFLFGPFLGQLWHIGRLKVEEDLHLKNSTANKE